MAERPKIALIYSYNSDWIAGAYYILNLVYALNKQEDKDKPELIILSYSLKEFETVQNTGYPYLKFHQLDEKDFWVSYTLLERIINKISRTFLKKNIIYREQTYKRLKLNQDLFFPATTHIYFSKLKNKLFWIPDFQEHFLPQFFSDQEILKRKTYQKMLAENAVPVVFSSNDASGHLKKIYPDSKSKTFVLQFAVTLPSYENISTDFLFRKYAIDKPYFFCPNQVWAHKNHIVVLNALKILKEKLVTNVLVVFSGKESDYRNPDFFAGLKTFVTENKIEDHVRFLGFIDRDEQLQLMNNAISVIQPSLFEGWSTVIEDAKSMGQFVIASDIVVHHEQLASNVTFFDPYNANQLAELMESYIMNPPVKNTHDYSKNVSIFGKTFIEIAKNCMETNN